MCREVAIAIAFSLLAAGLLWAAPAGATKLSPVAPVPPVEIEVDGSPYAYFPLEPGRPLAFAVDGPVRFEAICRWRFRDTVEALDVVVEASVDGEIAWRQIIRARPGSARYVGLPGCVPGRAGRVALDLPSGPHEIALSVLSPAEGVLDVNPLALTPEVMPWRLDWRASLAATYDSNVFRYSDEDLDDFAEDADIERYPMETADDVRLDPGFRLEFTREEPGVRETRLSFGGDWRLGIENGERSFAKLVARVVERDEAGAELAFSLSAIPSYELRPLWDDDVGAYRECRFRKHSGSVELGTGDAFPVELGARWRHDRYGYGPGFVEYDANANEVGLAVTARPARGLRIDAGYALRQSRARGHDEIGEARATSDDNDTTYDQDEYELRVRWEVGRWWGRRTALVASGRVERRFYLTSKSVADDPYHAGREDTAWLVSLRAVVGMSESLRLEAFVEQRGRDADLAGAATAMKDYDAWRTGVRLTVEGGRFLD